MELNLRKARKLESKISKFIMDERNSLNTYTDVRINADVQSEVLPVLNKVRGTFIDKVSNINSLIDARFLIRRMIGESNETSGINFKINNKVILEHKLSTFNNIDINSTLDSETLEDKSAILKTSLVNGDVNRYGEVRTSFSTNFLNPNDTEGFKKDKTSMIKNIEQLEDELLELNYSTKVKLDTNLVTLLQTNSLV